MEPTTEPKREGSIPTTFAVILIVVLVAAGAYFAWNDRESGVTEEMLLEDFDQTSAATDERIDTLSTESNSSTEVDAIESDFNEADLDPMDKEFEDFDRELGY